jgi:hypothetical protein
MAVQVLPSSGPECRTTNSPIHRSDPASPVHQGPREAVPSRHNIQGVA